MIYLTGDCHRRFERFDKENLIRLPHFIQPEDYIIVTGDFGLLWAKDKIFEYHLKWFSKLPFTILWVQGNHSNFNMIAEYPLELWSGGKARHIVRDKVILLERGQVFKIEGKSFFTFGGASSHDIQGGVLDKDSPTYDKDRKKAIRSGLPYRVRNVSWWEQELPTEEELQEGRDNLEKLGYSVDYVITHCMSGGMQEQLLDRFAYGHYGSTYKKDVLTDYFDELEGKLRYKCWFCGHYHVNLQLDDRHMVLYEDIVRLADFQ